MRRICRNLSSASVVVLSILYFGCGHAQQGWGPSPALDIPTIAEGPQRRVTAEDLITFRELGGAIGKGLSPSPEGNYFAFELHQADLSANKYRVAWFIAPTAPGAESVRVGDGGDPTLFRYRLPSGRTVGSWISEYASWSPDSRGIAYRKKINGETQIWWSERDGTDTYQLTHNAADIEEFFWNDKGSKIFFTTDADRVDLQELDASRYRSGYVFDYSKPWSTIDGKPFYPRYLLTGGSPRIWVLDVASGTERLATTEESIEYECLTAPIVPVPGLSKARRIVRASENGAIGWVQPDDPGKQGEMPPLTLYASRSADGSDPIRCSSAECTGIMDLAGMLRGGLQWSGDNDEILFVRKEGAAYSKRSLYAWRIGDAHAREVLTTDNMISDCSILHDRAVCFRETPTYPRVVISVSLADGSIETLVDPNPEFQRVTLGAVDPLQWKNALGYDNVGYLVKPPDYVPGRRYPLVFVGYRPETVLRGGVGDEYPVHLLAANGFVVLVYDQPRTFDALEMYSDEIEIGRARWGQPDQFDGRMGLASFEAAIELLDKQGLIDPKRVAATGLSSGVADVNYSLINSNLLAAAITSSSQWGPSANFLGGAAGEFIRAYRKAIGAGAYGGPYGFLWQHMSLSLNVERVQAPLLVNVGDSEHPWSLEEVTRLIENDRPVEMVVYPDEGHILWQPAHRISVYIRNVDWLNFWLNGIEDAAPKKAEQYARWRRLKEKRVKTTQSGNAVK